MAAAIPSATMPASKRTPQKKKAAGRQVQPPAKVATLVEAKHQADVAKKGGRPKKASEEQKIQAQVAKALRDNFAGMSEDEQRVIKVGDRTLVERLAEDKRAVMNKEKGAPTFGKHYYADLRRAYTASASDLSALEPLDDNAPLDDKLIAAVCASRSHGGNRQPLLEYMQLCTTMPNQSEVCGLFNHAAELKPHLGGTHLSVLLNLCSFIRKHQLETRYPKEVAAVLPTLDKALTCAYCTMKGKGFAPDIFWSAYADKAQVVVAKEPVERLLAADGDWTGHEAVISAVVGSSTLGAKMFGFAEEWVTINGVADTINRKLAQVLDGKNLTTELIDKCRTLMKQELDSKGPAAKAAYDKPRTAEITYRGRSLKLEVQGVWEEFNLKLDVYLKGIGMKVKRADGTPYLVSLFCEDELCPVAGAPPAITIDGAIYKQYNSCRISANSQLSKSRQAVSEHVLAFLDNNEEVLCMMDNSFRVEAEWLRDMAASGCQAVLEEKIMMELPSPASPRDPRDVASGVDRLKNGTVFMFASRDSQSTCNVVAEWAKAIANNRKPSFLCTRDSQFLQKVQSQMKYMLQVRVEGTETQAPRTLLAEAAAEHIIAGIQKQVDESSPIDMSDLQLLDTFSWLLTEAQLTKHGAWVKEAFSAAKPNAKIRSSATAAVGSSQTGKKQKAAQDLASTTMALFKKRRGTT